MVECAEDESAAMAKKMFEILIGKLRGHNALSEAVCESAIAQGNLALRELRGMAENRRLEAQRPRLEQEWARLKREQTAHMEEAARLRSERREFEAARTKLEIDGAAREKLGDVQRLVADAVRDAMREHSETVTKTVSGIREEMGRTSQLMTRHDAGLRRVDESHQKLAGTLSTMQARQSEVAEGAASLASGQAGLRDGLEKLRGGQDAVLTRTREMSEALRKTYDVAVRNNGVLVEFLAVHKKLLAAQTRCVEDVRKLHDDAKAAEKHAQKWTSEQQQLRSAVAEAGRKTESVENLVTALKGTAHVEAVQWRESGVQELKELRAEIGRVLNTMGELRDAQASAGESCREAMSATAATVAGLRTSTDALEGAVLGARDATCERLNVFSDAMTDARDVVGQRQAATAAALVQADGRLNDVVGVAHGIADSVNLVMATFGGNVDAVDELRESVEDVSGTLGDAGRRVEDTGKQTAKLTAVVSELDRDVRKALERMTADGQALADVADVSRSMQALSEKASEVLEASKSRDELERARATDRKETTAVEPEVAQSRGYDGQSLARGKRQRGDAGEDATADPSSPHGTKRARLAGGADQPWATAVRQVAQWMEILRPVELLGGLTIEELMATAFTAYWYEAPTRQNLRSFLEGDRPELQGRWLCWWAISIPEHPEDYAHRVCRESPDATCIEVMAVATGGFRYKQVERDAL
ncbi:hypothetical protein CONLIGDRAFT_697680 [Coniochaeta ligniaria NRRL 30616]|uniref:Uncharacterized protein n=1 Tax=Coniochaeta ligniaria NRRL 30616 TaxID=1408157 RepID=A0A1J7JDQ9_9PEZI|nr:hypothetical protein CONLIGDRAFT_697680 [Coniochaeta ligniaria NRRL 30616]